MDTDVYTTISFVAWSVAAFWMWKGALKGMVAHLVPRVVLACAVSLLAITYVFNFVHAEEVATNLRRPTGWAICVGLVWTSYTGIKAGKEWDEQRSAITKEVLGIIEQGRQQAEEENGDT